MPLNLNLHVSIEETWFFHFCALDSKVWNTDFHFKKCYKLLTIIKIIAMLDIQRVATKVAVFSAASWLPAGTIFSPKKYANELHFSLHTRLHRPEALAQTDSCDILKRAYFRKMKSTTSAVFDKGAAPLLTQFCDKCALSTAHWHFPFAFFIFSANSIYSLHI